MKFRFTDDDPFTQTKREFPYVRCYKVPRLVKTLSGNMCALALALIEFIIFSICFDTLVTHGHVHSMTQSYDSLR